MKKSRKLIGLLVISILSMASLFGCSTKQGDTSNSLGKPPSESSGTAKVTRTAAYTQNGETVSKSNQTITASNSNQSGIKVSKSGNLILSDSTITTSGKTTSEDDSNFYGLNAAVLAESGSKITISNSAINTSGEGANAVFATGTGSTVNVSDVTIKTTADSSRGLDATMDGMVNANNVNVTTAGIHCAAIATDRGEGTVNVTGGTMNTSGVDSPGIYSTGKITVSGATIIATGSEAAVVEGKNSITLTDTNLSGSKKNGVMLYQSFSGDAATGTSSFNMTGGSLAGGEGAMFYVTNTQSIVELKGVKITNASGILLKAGSDRWGNSGSNGGTMTFKADNETLTGNVICDKISSIDIKLQNNTILKGSINSDNKLATVAISLDAASQWNVTGDSYIKSLTDADSTLANIKDNGYTIYYDSSNSGNSWLNGKTIKLAQGGKLVPMK